jgi:hypothetical protein
MDGSIIEKLAAFLFIIGSLSYVFWNREAKKGVLAQFNEDCRNILLDISQAPNIWVLSQLDAAINMLKTEYKKEIPPGEINAVVASLHAAAKNRMAYLESIEKITGLLNANQKQK